MATAKIPDKPTNDRRPSPGQSTGVTQASAWKNKVSDGIELEVPSGNICLVRAGGLEVFVKQGLVPNTLMPIVQEAMTKGKPPSQDQLSLEDNPKLLEDVIEMVNNMALFCVIEPELRPVILDEGGLPVDLRKRPQGNFLYVDDVDFADKMFIFNFAVGGTADLEKFRAELDQQLESVPAR